MIYLYCCVPLIACCCPLLVHPGGGELQPLGGLTEFLAWVDAKGLRKAAVTNAPKPNTQLMLKALALDQYFEVGGSGVGLPPRSLINVKPSMPGSMRLHCPCAALKAVVHGEECARAKPFPDPYLEGMRLLGLEPEATLVVEDSPAGIKVRPRFPVGHAPPPPLHTHTIPSLPPRPSIPSLPIDAPDPGAPPRRLPLLWILHVLFVPTAGGRGSWYPGDRLHDWAGPRGTESSWGIPRVQVGVSS